MKCGWFGLFLLSKIRTIKTGELVCHSNFSAFNSLSSWTKIKAHTHTQAPLSRKFCIYLLVYKFIVPFYQTISTLQGKVHTVLDWYNKCLQSWHFVDNFFCYKLYYFGRNLKKLNLSGTTRIKNRKQSIEILQRSLQDCQIEPWWCTVFSVALETTVNMNKYTWINNNNNNNNKTITGPAATDCYSMYFTSFDWRILQYGCYWDLIFFKTLSASSVDMTSFFYTGIFYIIILKNYG